MTAQKTGQQEMEHHLLKVKEFLRQLFMTDRFDSDRLKELIDSNQDKIDELRKLLPSAPRLTDEMIRKYLLEKYKPTYIKDQNNIDFDVNAGYREAAFNDMKFARDHFDQSALPDVRDEKPKIICTIGSSRFADVEAVVKWKLEQAGYLCVGMHLLPEWYAKEEGWKGDHHGAEQEGCANHFDELHLKKILMSDIVVVIDVDKYIGERTRFERDYALQNKKPVIYLEDEFTTSVQTYAQLKSQINNLYSKLASLREKKG